MNVIAHQQYAYTLEPYAVDGVLAVTAEDHLPLIATADPMVKCPGKSHSGFAGHSALICHNA